MILEWIASIFLVTGAFFMLVAALGVIKLPDVFTRMHAATKASSFGTGLMLVGTIAYFREPFIFLESLLVIVFIFLTAPVASHMIGRAAYLLKVPLWQGTVVDQLHGKYNLHTHELLSDSPPADSQNIAKDLKD
ncbi:Na+/H+ antiporter subunit G [candidate division KSB1 bacterium]|nr:Na+/H+ antiporter subunit G [candidate division KSB1 bacterium]